LYIKRHDFLDVAFEEDKLRSVPVMASTDIIDFNLTAVDYGCIHVAVVPLGNLNAPLFSSICSTLDSCPPFQLAEPKQYLNFKFLTSIPRWGSGRVDWSTIQAHKQILGVLAVCQCLDAAEFHEVTHGFDSACSKHPKACDSRCIAFGPTSTLGHLVDLRRGVVLVDLPPEQVQKREEIDSRMFYKILQDFASTMHGKLQQKIKDFHLQFSEIESKVRPENILLSPFVESKALSRQVCRGRAAKHLGDLYLLSGQGGDALLWYNKAVAFLKNRSDHLWTGAAQEALACTAILVKHYNNLSTPPVSTHLSAPGGRGSPDVGTFLMARKLTQRRGKKPNNVESTVSATTSATPKTTPPKSVSMPTPAKSAFVTTPTQPASITTHPKSTSTSTPNSPMNSKHRNTTSPTALETEEVKLEISDPPSPSLSHKQNGGHHFFSVRSSRLGSDPTDTSPLLHSNGSVTSSSIASGDICPPSVVLQEEDVNGEDERVWTEEGSVEEDVDGLKLRILEREYPSDKYGEAVQSFTKALPLSGPMYIEALLRFSRHLADVKNLEHANRILTQAYQYRRILSDVDQIALDQTIAGIYDGIGFRRKAAMFTHFAGLDAFRVGKQTPNKGDYFRQSHDLLWKSLNGYQHCLQPHMKGASPHGWCRIQATILRDLVIVADTFGHFVLVKRHACHLLQGLYKHLPDQDLRFVINILSEDAKRGESSSKMSSVHLLPLKDEPTLPLRDVPCVNSFVPQELKDDLYPHRRHGYTPPPSPSSGPFIVSSLHYMKSRSTKEVLWVANTAFEISITISNPLPFRIKVEDLRLWVESDSVPIQTTQSSLTLPPGGDPQQFNLLAIPQGAGELRIRGYQAKVFGVKSQCEVQMMDGFKTTVLPCLPNLRLRLKMGHLFHKSTGHAGSEDILDHPLYQGPVEMFDGEICNMAVVLENGRESLVTNFTFKLNSDKKDDRVQFDWSQKEVESLIPLAHDTRRYFLLKLTAAHPKTVRVPDEDSDTDGVHQSEIAVLSSSTAGRRLSALDLPTEGKIMSFLKRTRRTVGSMKQQSSVDSMRSKSSTIATNKKISLGEKYSSSSLKKKMSLPDPPSPRSQSPTPPTNRKHLAIPHSQSQLSLVHPKDSRSATPTSTSSGCGSEGTDSTSHSSTTTAYPDVRERLDVAMVTRSNDSRFHPILDIPMPSTSEELSYVFGAEYSGGPGGSKGYYRKTVLSVLVQLKPSFVFCKFDVTPSRR
jgi:hypothetical protein